MVFAFQSIKGSWQVKQHLARYAEQETAVRLVTLVDRGNIQTRPFPDPHSQHQQTSLSNLQKTDTIQQRQTWHLSRRLWYRHRHQQRTSQTAQTSRHRNCPSARTLALQPALWQHNRFGILKHVHRCMQHQKPQNPGGPQTSSKAFASFPLWLLVYLSVDPFSRQEKNGQVVCSSWSQALIDLARTSSYGYPFFSCRRSQFFHIDATCILLCRISESVNCILSHQ